MVTIEVAPPPREASVIDVAVLLLAAIVVIGTLRSALGPVDVEVAVVSVDHTHGSLVHSLAGCPFHGTGAIERSDISRVAGIDGILHVACVSDVPHVKNVGRLGVRGGVADISIERPICRALPIVRAGSRSHTHQPHKGQRSNLYCP